MDFIEFMIYLSIYIGLIATSFYLLSFFAGKKQKKELFEEKDLPTVSIIIPMHNEEKSIEGTLNSILKSDYPKGKFEIIVVDDGSTDKTLELAKKFKEKIGDKRLMVFSKKRGGKGSALNFGIKKCKGEIFFSMDADTFVEPWSVKNMVRYFKNKEVMCVTPAMTLYKPKGILQKIQHIEYLTGLFLRKTFSSLNAMHITPGAFSAYKKSFVERYGGYDEDNITEDLELSLRVQFKGYVIENSPESPAYTIAPKKFVHLLKQRRRWYIGLMRNTWKYRKIISPKYGDLGLFVLPIAWISIFLCVFITVSLFFKALFEVRDELIFLNSVNFDFLNVLDINFYFIERLAFLFISNPVIIFLFFFIIILGVYLFYASKKIKTYGIVSGLAVFFLFFAVLFGFWWVVSLVYVALNRKISWK
jgi:cellulose synthase/poly-beta-1,6-N-acetylglucosamine synthase-like glycosyltransferase